MDWCPLRGEIVCEKRQEEGGFWYRKKARRDIVQDVRARVGAGAGLSQVVGTK